MFFRGRNVKHIVNTLESDYILCCGSKIKQNCAKCIERWDWDPATLMQLEKFEMIDKTNR